MDVRRRTPPRPYVTFHPPNGLERDLSRSRKLGSAPTKERSRGADLRRRYHDVVLFDPIMILLD